MEKRPKKKNDEKKDDGLMNDPIALLYVKPIG